jgi:hypothetical protein
MKYLTFLVCAMAMVSLALAGLPRSPEMIAREKLVRRNLAHHVPRRGPEPQQLVERGKTHPSPIPHPPPHPPPRPTPPHKKPVIYDVTTKIIIVTVYVVTETEYLYEVKCHYDKWKKTCDYRVSYSLASQLTLDILRRTC